jgi:hypothetical protein
MIKELTLAESQDMSAKNSKECFRITCLPQLDDGYGTVECIIPHGLKIKLLSAPGFPKAPMSVPKRVDLREMYTGEIPEFDQSNPVFPQLGMFATEDIEAGTCIMDERPMIISSHCLAASDQPNMSPQQVLNIMKNDMNDLVKTAWDRLPRRRQIIFLSLANAHTDGDDASRPFLGRVRTNALGCGLDDPENQYGGICSVLSRVNHRYAFISLLSTSSIC